MSKKKQDDIEEWEEANNNSKNNFIPIVPLKRVREGDLVRVKPKGFNKWLDGKIKKISYLDEGGLGTGRPTIEALSITYACNCYRTPKGCCKHVFLFKHCGMTWKRDNWELRKLRLKEKRKMEELAVQLKAEEKARLDKINNKKKAATMKLQQAVIVANRAQIFEASKFARDVVVSSEESLRLKMKEKKERIKQIMESTQDIETENERLAEHLREKRERREERAKERKEAANSANAKRHQATNSKGLVSPTKLEFEAFSIEEPPGLQEKKKKKKKKKNSNNHERTAKNRERNEGTKKEERRTKQETIETALGNETKKEKENGKRKRGGIMVKEGEYVHVLSATGVLRTEDGPQMLYLQPSESLMPCCTKEPHCNFLCYPTTTTPIPSSFSLDASVLFY